MGDLWSPSYNKKRDKLYLEVHMTSPNSNINKLKSTELENKTRSKGYLL